MYICAVESTIRKWRLLQFLYLLLYSAAWGWPSAILVKRGEKILEVSAASVAVKHSGNGVIYFFIQELTYHAT